MKYILGAPVILFQALLIPGRNLSESAQKTAVRNQVAGPAMIRVSVLQCTGKNNFWTVFAQCLYHLSLVYFIILKKSVGHTEDFTDIQIHYTGCCFRLLL